MKCILTGFTLPVLTISLTNVSIRSQCFFKPLRSDTNEQILQHMGALTIKLIRHLSLFIFLIVSFSGRGQDILLKGLKNKYPINSKISFTVTNNASLNKVYSISLELYKENSGWHEVRMDIFNYQPTKKTQIFGIGKTKSNEHTFIPSKYRPFRPSKGLKYRLKINYGDLPDKRDLIVYSDSFMFY